MLHFWNNLGSPSSGKLIVTSYMYICISVFTLNFLPYKPTGTVSSNIYRPTINSTVPNLKTTLMTINSNHQNSKDDDVHVPNIIWTCQSCISSELLKSIGFIGFADKKCESPIKTT
jgi:hypothetical protein